MEPEAEDVADFRRTAKKGFLVEDCRLGLVVHMQCSRVGVAVYQKNPLRVSMAAPARLDQVNVGYGREYLRPKVAVYVGDVLVSTTSAKVILTPQRAETSV